MGRLLIRNLDDAVIAKLRQRAAAKGNSMEEEARQALARDVGHDVEAWLADVRAFAAALPPSDKPAEEVIRELRDERTEHLLSLISAKSEPRR